MFVDPNGEVAWFVPLIIGAVIGGTAGGMIGHANGATGWDMFGYIAGGALIGGLSSGAAVGVSAIGGGAMIAGMAAGTVAGAGFSGLATGWNGEAMLKGAALGGLSGFVGGGFAAAIGGGWGAFVGGAVGAGLNTALYGGSGKDILISALVGGALAYGTYELTSFLSYKRAGLEIDNYKVTYSQFKTMQADYQRSRFWHKEYGGILTQDGGVVRAPAAYREKYGVNFDPAWTAEALGRGSVTHYHTHWDGNNLLLGYDMSGNQIRTASGPSVDDMSFVARQKSFWSAAFLIDRQSFYYYDGAGIQSNNGFTMLRHFPFYWRCFK